jgi:hypothetical protein
MKDALTGRELTSQPFPTTIPLPPEYAEEARILIAYCEQMANDGEDEFFTTRRSVALIKASPNYVMAGPKDLDNDQSEYIFAGTLKFEAGELKVYCPRVGTPRG